jgi:heat shock protein HslJ
LVELRDISIADAPPLVVAEQRIEPAGRQVPVPFRLTLDRTKLASGRRYSVRGMILGPERQVLWTTTEPHPVDPAAAKAALGTLVMKRAPAEGERGPAGGDPRVQDRTFTATGNEPGWKLEITSRQITLLTNNGTTRVAAPWTAPEVTGNGTRYTTDVDGRPLTATIANRPCADSMTGMPHPNTVVVSFDGRDFRGCGGNPAQLLQGVPWRVEDISGQGIVDGAQATLNFAPDGSVSGRSFCNTFRGNYTLTGESLSITLGASTLMACAPALMNQETLFVNMLADVRRFEMGSDGVLTLHTNDGRTITARRER